MLTKKEIRAIHKVFGRPMQGFVYFDYDDLKRYDSNVVIKLRDDDDIIKDSLILKKVNIGTCCFYVYLDLFISRTKNFCVYRLSETHRNHIN